MLNFFKTLGTNFMDNMGAGSPFQGRMNLVPFFQRQTRVDPTQEIVETDPRDPYRNIGDGPEEPLSPEWRAMLSLDPNLAPEIDPMLGRPRGVIPGPEIRPVDPGLAPEIGSMRPAEPGPQGPIPLQAVAEGNTSNPRRSGMNRFLMALSEVLAPFNPNPELQRGRAGGGILGAINVGSRGYDDVLHRQNLDREMAIELERRKLGDADADITHKGQLRPIEMRHADQKTRMGDLNINLAEVNNQRAGVGLEADKVGLDAARSEQSFLDQVRPHQTRTAVSQADRAAAEARKSINEVTHEEVQVGPGFIRRYDPKTGKTEIVQAPVSKRDDDEGYVETEAFADPEAAAAIDAWEAEQIKAIQANTGKGRKAQETARKSIKDIRTAAKEKKAALPKVKTRQKMRSPGQPRAAKPISDAEEKRRAAAGVKPGFWREARKHGLSPDEVVAAWNNGGKNDWKGE